MVRFRVFFCTLGCRPPDTAAGLHGNVRPRGPQEPGSPPHGVQEGASPADVMRQGRPSGEPGRRLRRVGPRVRAGLV